MALKCLGEDGDGENDFSGTIPEWHYGDMPVNGENVYYDDVSGAMLPPDLVQVAVREEMD